jgi:hypothetical protein
MSNSDRREEYIRSLEEFKRLSNSYRYSKSPELRTAINKQSNHVQKLVRAAHAMKSMTIAPPPAVGGLVMHDLNPFDLIFKEYYGLDIIEHVIDCIDEAIGYIEANKDFTIELSKQFLNTNNDTINKPMTSSTTSAKESTKILGMTQEAFWPLLVAVIGATFYIGFRLGQAKFDSEKIDLYDSNQSYKQENYNLQKQLGAVQWREIQVKDSLIEARRQLKASHPINDSR